MKPAADALTDRLVAGLTPVAPIRRRLLVASIVAVQVAVAAAAVVVTGLDAGRAARLLDPAFVALALALAAGAVVSANAVADASIPGRGPAPWVGRTLVALPLLLAASIVAISPWGGTWKGALAVLVEGFGCTRTTLLVAAPVWLAALMLLGRTVPLDPLRVGLFAGFSSLLTGAFVVQLECPVCDSYHLALCHYAPLLLAAWAVAVATSLVLGRRRAE